MARQNISSGAPWEEVVGYSRAVKVGPHLHVSGTTAVDDSGEVVGRGDAYVQASYILQKIAAALAEGGATLSQVVRTRMYLTNVGNWEAVGRAHGEVFGDIRPASTLLEVSALITKDLLVEIEVDAYLGD